MYRKIITVSSYALIAYLLFHYSGDMLAWMREGNHYLWTILIAVCFASIPIMPYPVVGGMIGVAYGPFFGFLVCWTASTIASLLMFLLMRFGFRDWGERFIENNDYFRKINHWVVKHQFAMVLFGRMLPILPAAIVNTYAAISGMTFVSYALASALGKLPANFMYAFVGSGIAEGNRGLGWAIALYMMVIVFAWFWMKRSQERDLVIESKS